MRFAFENVGCSEEAIVGLLKKIIGQLGISGSAPQENPEGARGALVHSGECVLIHLKRLVGFKGFGLQPVQFGVSEFTHRFASCLCWGFDAGWQSPNRLFEQSEFCRNHIRRGGAHDETYSQTNRENAEDMDAADIVRRQLWVALYKLKCDSAQCEDQPDLDGPDNPSRRYARPGAEVDRHRRRLEKLLSCR